MGLWETYLEDSDPGVPNVIKVNSPFVGVDFPRPAHVVVLVPVDAAILTGTLQGAVGGAGEVCAELALLPRLLQRGQVVAVQHAVVPVGGADEGDVLSVLVLVVRAQEGKVVHPVKSERKPVREAACPAA